MKLVILDRDGIINQDSIHYIKSPEEFILIPGSCEAIARLTSTGYTVAVATNQSGISRGFYNEAQLDAIHEKMKYCVEKVGGKIDYIVYCRHMPDEGCNCRKPQPGMLLNIAQYFSVSLHNVPFIGDRVSDIKAAEAAGALPMLILSPMTDRSDLLNYAHVPIFHSLAHCVDTLLSAKHE